MDKIIDGILECMNNHKLICIGFVVVHILIIYTALSLSKFEVDIHKYKPNQVITHEIEEEQIQIKIRRK